MCVQGEVFEKTFYFKMPFKSLRVGFIFYNVLDLFFTDFEEKMLKYPFISCILI